MYCKSPIIFDLLLSSSKPIWSIWTCCWFETLSRFTSSLGAWSFDGFSPVYSEKKGNETQIRVTSTILTNYVAQFPFFWLRRLRSQTPKSLESKGYADHLSPTATFFGGQSIHWFLFQPLYNGHFFGGQSIHWLLFQPLYKGHFVLSPRWLLWRSWTV